MEAVQSLKALRTILFPLCWRDKDVYLEIFRENKERYKAMPKREDMISSFSNLFLRN